MRDDWDSYLTTLQGASRWAAGWLTWYQDAEEVLVSEAEAAVRVSNVALQVGTARGRRAPASLSAPERYVLRNEELILTAKKVKEALANTRLDFLAAQVLYRHVWQRLALSRLAEFLDVTWYELAAARRRLVEAAAASLKAAGLDGPPPDR